jgi:hypothetical protein
MLSPGHHLEEIQSHLTLILTSKLRSLTVIELQNSQNSTQTSPPLPCNQVDACIYINKNLKTLISIWFCLLKMMFTPRSGQPNMLCSRPRLSMSQLNNGSMMIRMDPSIMLPTQLTLLRTMKGGLCYSILAAKHQNSLPMHQNLEDIGSMIQTLVSLLL